MRNVPKLRFKEFSGEWEEKRLGDIILKLNAGVSVNSNEQENITKTTKAILKTSCIFNGKFTEDEAKKILDEELDRVELFPKKGNLIISRMNTPLLVGAVAYIEKDFINRFLPDRLWQTEFKDKDYDGKCLSYLLNTTKYNFKIRDLATGTSNSMKNISKESFLNLDILITKEKEQEKIADFLSNVDKKISITEEKLSLFNEYKKGIMQKIFSQELRFKDENGNDYPEWEEKKLGDILIKNKEKNKENKYNLVQSISNKYGFVNQDEYFEDRRVASKDLKNYYVAKKKLFAYNPSRINVGSLAYKKGDNISVISPLYVSFYAKKENLIDIFLLNWFFSLPFIRQMSCSFEGSVRNNLSYETLSNFIIDVPCLEEQQKIADFLSAIDTKIEKISDELENLKEFKKGLLQQMFV